MRCTSFKKDVRLYNCGQRDGLLQRSRPTLTSSISRIARHIPAMSSVFRKLTSTVAPSLSLPLVKDINGLRRCSDVASADNVFPTPGGPCRPIMRPLPFPRTKSGATVSLPLACASTSARRRSLWLSTGRMSPEKASSFHSIGETWRTLKRTASRKFDQP